MDLKPGGLYQGLTGLISGHGGQKTGLRVLVWVLDGPWGGGRTDGRKDGRKDGRTSGNSPLCPTGHRPFGAAAQKREKWEPVAQGQYVVSDTRCPAMNVGDCR